VADLQEECLHDEFLDTIARPRVALWLQVEVKMFRLDRTNRPGLLQGLALGSFTVREPPRRGSFGKNPSVSTGSLDQQKLVAGAALSVTDRRHLERKEPCRTHELIVQREMPGSM